VGAPLVPARTERLAAAEGTTLPAAELDVLVVGPALTTDPAGPFHDVANVGRETKPLDHSFRVRDSPRPMAGWTLNGTYIEFCSCEAGCACNFQGAPNSPEGNCQALITHRIEDGAFDGLELAGATVSWALWWPGAIHERGGRGHAFVDCSSDEQYEVLSRIWRGEEGYSLYEIFNSTLDQPTTVERGSIDLTVDGKNSRVKIGDGIEAVMTPLRNPVTGDENNVRIVKDGGFIWADGEIATNEQVRVATPEVSFEVAGRHSVFAPFSYAT
jgi:hypothetical protein